MQTCTNNEGLTIVNFGIESANAATLMDLLSACKPRGILFLGKCGGLKRSTEIGRFILPIAAIRGEGTSDDYLPPEVPALPSFKLHKFVSDTLIQYEQEYRTGVIYTTNRRVWEWDRAFHKRLTRLSVIGIDMETALIEAANRRARERGLQSRADFRVLPVTPGLPDFRDESFDVAMNCGGAFIHLSDKQSAFADCWRVLKPGGTITGYEWMSRNLEHSRMMDDAFVDLEPIFMEPLSAYGTQLEAAGFVDIEIDSEEFQFRENDELRTPTNTASFKVVAHKPA